MTTPIDEVFGGVKLNTVICRECHTVSDKLINDCISNVYTTPVLN